MIYIEVKNSITDSLTGKIFMPYGWRKTYLSKQEQQVFITVCHLINKNEYEDEDIFFTTDDFINQYETLFKEDADCIDGDFITKTLNKLECLKFNILKEKNKYTYIDYFIYENIDDLGLGIGYYSNENLRPISASVLTAKDKVTHEPVKRFMRIIEYDKKFLLANLLNEVPSNKYETEDSNLEIWEAVYDQNESIDLTINEYKLYSMKLSNS